MVHLERKAMNGEDERYRQPRNRASISKWLRQSINLYDNFEDSMEGLRSLFNTQKEPVDSKMLGFQDKTVEQKSKIAKVSRSKRLSCLRNGTSISRSSSPPAQTFIQVKEEAKT
ncbi:unnamed protein product [Microthlaspi erraticum]|uniref:Uncharacterized protein n=1 Tax=Microthlaspi erraticum TaxID=1685480 RepID=A0A6D2HT29_9BRAS|nr:unnamed protein product [Microthlaspi erraticum]CAA7049686.1 unnamed protein product [Microthlaspi erraticum]